jgi:hypothetical protein
VRIIIASLVVLGAPITLLAAPSSKIVSIPKVKISYASMFDVVCGKQLNYEIDQNVSKEVTDRLPVFQNNWDHVAGELLGTTQKIILKNFSEHEISLALSACDFPSMSNPLLINIRYSLSSFTDHPLEKDVTMSIFFHEILHRYLDDKIPSNSQLLEKYKGENETVLSHLHLFALQKAVYLRLKQDSILQKVIAKDQSLPNGSYKRAWQIINDLENYQDFLRELQQ